MNYSTHQDTDKNAMYELACLSQNNTGLPVVIWICSNTQNRKIAPRLFANSNYQLIFIFEDAEPISIEFDSSSEFPFMSDDNAKITKFIKLNKAFLLKYWNGNIDTVDFIVNMKKV